MEMGPRSKVLSEGLKKPGIEHMTPGLLVEWRITRVDCMYKYIKLRGNLLSDSCL